MVGVVDLAVVVIDSVVRHRSIEVEEDDTDHVPDHAHDHVTEKVVDDGILDLDHVIDHLESATHEVDQDLHPEIIRGQSQSRQETEYHNHVADHAHNRGALRIPRTIIKIQIIRDYFLVYCVHHF